MCGSSHQGGHGQCHGRQGRHGAPDRHACCCRGGHFHRHVFGRQEELTRLQHYLQDLQAEIRAVEERINDLKH